MNFAPENGPGSTIVWGLGFPPPGAIPEEFEWEIWMGSTSRSKKTSLGWKFSPKKDVPGTPSVLFFSATLPLKPATITLKIGHLAFQVVKLGIFPNFFRGENSKNHLKVRTT